VSEHLYEVSLQKTTTAAAGPIVSIIPGALGAGIRMPSIREIGVYNQSGAAAEVGLGLPAAIGVGAATGTLVQALDQIDAAGHTNLATSFATTQPTAPTNFYRRAQIQAVAGAGAIWTWGQDEWPLWSGATIPHVVVWQISAVICVYDVYLKVSE
jgi:hypothetical protein